MNRVDTSGLLRALDLLTLASKFGVAVFNVCNSVLTIT
jgi:hypothetical protein